MDFFMYYKSISNKKEKIFLRKQIIENCRIQYPTFYSWLAREKIPFLAQKVISDILEKEHEELFPNDF